MDVLDFRDFYTTPLGDVVQSAINMIVQRVWPNFTSAETLPITSSKNKITLAYGYALPYLNEKTTQVAFMPAHLGVIGWPKQSPRIALVEEDLLPLPDRCVERMLVIHGLETSLNPTAFLEECWRVLSAEGHLLIITPNRRGLWAQRDSTPLGRGQPYTMTQLSRILRQTSFTPTKNLRALYTPPFDSHISISAHNIFEKIGPLITPKFSGLVAIKAVKTVYKGEAVPSYSRRLKIALTTAKAATAKGNDRADA
jgi:hypothetical protein